MNKLLIYTLLLCLLLPSCKHYDEPEPVLLSQLVGTWTLKSKTWLHHDVMGKLVGTEVDEKEKSYTFDKKEVTITQVVNGEIEEETYLYEFEDAVGVGKGDRLAYLSILDKEERVFDVIILHKETMTWRSTTKGTYDDGTGELITVYTELRINLVRP